MRKQAFNPYLPSWEYIPDGEPHIFGDRVYVYGSHDYFNGYVFCQGDYVCWSAPIDDLSDWRCEGTIYKKNNDPANSEEKMCLYAPDITQGNDGRYYLYYVLDKLAVVSVAVCDTPAGKFEFYGYVHDKNGNRLGEREQDEPQFDPAVLTENDKTYLYTGFCGANDKSRTGAMVTVLGKDMLTIEEDTEFIIPGCMYSEGSGFEQHEFFEASSIRKYNNTYYFVYSSIVMHELCYATSLSPTKDFVYGGVIVSNADLHIDTYKPADKPTAYAANNHGGLVKIGENYYIFYHRHTNGTWFSRQGCAERVHFDEHNHIQQVELTSCGLNGQPLAGHGYYPAYIACNLFTDENSNHPKITQDGRDNDKFDGYIANMGNLVTAGFKYFDCHDVTKIRIATRGYCSGVFEVRTAYNGPVLASLPVSNANVWENTYAALELPDGICSIYLTYKGSGSPSLAGFELFTSVK